MTMNQKLKNAQRLGYKGKSLKPGLNAQILWWAHYNLSPKQLYKLM
jgi:hypothetical protein